VRVKYAEIDKFKGQFFHFWRRYELDALICPVNATPALPVDIPQQLFCTYWSYCALYNLLNYTAGTVKCTDVTAADEASALDGPESKRGGLDDNDCVSRLLRKCQKGSAGLPVGIQVVTLPYREEMCLRLMKEIEAGVRQ